MISSERNNNWLVGVKKGRENVILRLQIFWERDLELQYNIFSFMFWIVNSFLWSKLVSFDLELFEFE